MAPAFNAFHTFLFSPDETTHNGSQVRAADDLKLTMNTVIKALIPGQLFSSAQTPVRSTGEYAARGGNPRAPGGGHGCHARRIV